MQKNIVFLVCFFAVFPIICLARTGVGIGTGKIEMGSLKAWNIYQLPPLTIFNTGDEPCNYQMGVQYQLGQEEQGQNRPLAEWFIFEPSSFYLEAGKAQTVEVQMTLPLKAVPGKYFAYLEGKTVHQGGGGGARIGVAAGAQLYFTIAPSNIFQAVYYRTAFLFKKYSPWSWVGLWLIVGAIAIVIFRFIFKKFFKLQIGISRKQGTASKKPKTTTNRRQKKQKNE